MFKKKLSQINKLEPKKRDQMMQDFEKSPEAAKKIKTPNPEIRTPKARGKKKEVAMTPALRFKELNKALNCTSFETELKKYLYETRKFLIDKEKGVVRYAVCTDPFGFPVYVSLDTDEVSVVKGLSNIFISETEGNNLTHAFKENVKQKMSHEIYGLVLHSQCEYVFLIHTDEGNIETSNFTSCESGVENSKLPRAYAILRFTEILNNPSDALERTKNTYEIIQNQQLKLLKDSVSTLNETVKEAKEAVDKFNESHTSISEIITDDSATLYSYASEYFDRFTEKIIDKEEVEKFAEVSNNLFHRFQQFNHLVQNSTPLLEISARINDCIKRVNDIAEEMNKEAKDNGLIIDECDVNVEI